MSREKCAWEEMSLEEMSCGNGRGKFSDTDKKCYPQLCSLNTDRGKMFIRMELFVNLLDKKS